ncbi:hypothetical protein [Paraliomyxa miuraensis]|uniref:hypothetical protein n=1 Tax=Paraliomyxa miuraensis TaxID=376150 RepID=UPI00224C7CB9|nr:hypothetical protein [Paraliomyxa miuraensis]MCX4247704.1 hypothetical protein [Paraliomyxa miuraensis]
MLHPKRADRSSATTARGLIITEVEVVGKHLSMLIDHLDTLHGRLVHRGRWRAHDAQAAVPAQRNADPPPHCGSQGALDLVATADPRFCGHAPARR